MSQQGVRPRIAGNLCGARGETSNSHLAAWERKLKSTSSYLSATTTVDDKKACDQRILGPDIHDEVAEGCPLAALVKNIEVYEVGKRYQPPDFIRPGGRSPWHRCRTSSGVERPLAHDRENDDDEQQKAEPAARVVAPPGAIRPSGQSPHHQQQQDDQEHEVHRSP
jgi:hypothetical protein